MDLADAGRWTGGGLTALVSGRVLRCCRRGGNGAYWGAFGPGYTAGRPDTDLLLTRTIEPVATPAAALLRMASGRPRGADTALGIR